MKRSLCAGLALVALCFFFFGQTATRALAGGGYVGVLSISPLDDEGRVGDTHTVVATVRASTGVATSFTIHFKILSGPDAGLTSPSGGICSPFSCSQPGLSGQVSWSYGNNGGPGVDKIQACSEFHYIQGEFGDEEECVVASMTWVAAGAFPAAVAGAAGEAAARNRARVVAPASAAPASLAAAATINPPNTGDGGLRNVRSSGTDRLAYLAALALLLLYSGWATARATRSSGP